MALTTDQLQANLAAARDALHKLLIGKEVSLVTYEGRTVQYSPRDLGHVPLLKEYIRELEGMLGERPARSKAISILF